jgi:hypothetical protein
MPIKKLPNMVACVGAVGSASDATALEQVLTVAFNTEEGDRYLLPLTEPAVQQLLKVISAWRRDRDFADQQEPSTLQHFFAGKRIA